MFPLPLVAIQEEEVHLHIFEPRYKNLIQACAIEKLHFGIPVMIENKMKNTGAEMELLEIAKTYENGEMDVICQAVSRFKILDFQVSNSPNKAAQASVEILEFLYDEDKEFNVRLFDLLHEFYALAGVDAPENLFKRLSLASIYHKCGMNIHQEYEFAELNSTRARQWYLTEHLKKLVPVLTELQLMKKKIQLNGHYKKLPQSF